MKEKELTITKRISTAKAMLIYLRCEIKKYQPKNEYLTLFIDSIIEVLDI